MERRLAAPPVTDNDHGTVAAIPAPRPTVTTFSPAPASDVDVHPCVLTLQKSLLDIYRAGEIDTGGGITEEGAVLCEEFIQINLVMISRVNLHDDFQDEGFDSSGDLMRAEHSLTAAGQRRENIALESLFQNIPDIVLTHGASFRVFVLASGGCGKTTIFTKIATCRWARKELWPEFDILIALELRHEDVRGAKSFRELLEVAGLDCTEAERRAVRSYFKLYPQRLCIVFDGLDETSRKKCSRFVQRIFEGEELKGIRIIITSRPCPDILSLCSEYPNDGRVEVIGFRREDVERYVLKRLGPTDGAGLVAEVKKDAHLLAMMCTPILACEICKLYYYRPQHIPRCLSDIFNLMILRLAGRRHSTKFDSWDEIPADTRQQILELGKFAFHMLRLQHFVFTEADLQKFSMSKEAIQLGFLVTSDRSPSSRKKQWRFSHLTFQENLSAKFVASCKNMSPKYIIHLVESLGPQSGHLRTFWILLAAQLSFSLLETLVNSLATRRRREIPCIEPDANADSLAASNTDFPLNITEVLCGRLRRDAMDRLADNLLCNFVQESAVTFIENKMKWTGTSSHESFLKTLLLHWVEVEERASPQMLIQILRCVDDTAASCCQEQLADASPTLETISLPMRPCTDTQISLIFSCYAEHCRHSGDGPEPLPSIFDFLLVHGLSLSGDEPPFMGRVNDLVIQGHQIALQSVKLRSFTATSSCQLPPALGECTTLKDININTCKDQWQVVAQSIRNSANFLERVVTFRSSISHGDMVTHLAPALQRCRKLKQYNLLVSSPASARACLSPNMVNTSLTHLQLSGESYQLPEAEQLRIPYLSRYQALRQLCLQQFHLTSSSLDSLAEAASLLERGFCLTLRKNWISATQQECNAFNKKMERLGVHFTYVRPSHNQ